MSVLWPVAVSLLAGYLSLIGVTRFDYESYLAGCGMWLVALTLWVVWLT